MASTAPNMGTPMRAPTIVPFPDTRMARARRELNYCRNHKMLSKWSDRVRANTWTTDERFDLACRCARRHLEISLAEGN